MKCFESAQLDGQKVGDQWLVLVLTCLPKLKGFFLVGHCRIDELSWVLHIDQGALETYYEASFFEW